MQSAQFFQQSSQPQVEPQLQLQPLSLPIQTSTPFAPPLYQLPNCIICMQPFSDQFYFLRCGHIFHQFCILNCLQVNRQCPICKSRVQSEQEVKKLFLDLKLGNDTGKRILEMMEEMKKDQGEVGEKGKKTNFEKALAKLRNSNLMKEELEKQLNDARNVIDGLRLENRQMEERHEETRRENIIFNRKVKDLVKNQEQHNRNFSFIQSLNEQLTKKVQQQDKQLQKYLKSKKIEDQRAKKGEDSKLLQEIKNNYLKNHDAAGGLEYFSQVAQSYKNDIKQLEKNLKGYEKILKDRNRTIDELKNKVESMATQEIELQTEYYQLEVIVKSLKRRIAEFNRRRKDSNGQDSIQKRSELDSSQLEDEIDSELEAEISQNKQMKQQERIKRKEMQKQLQKSRKAEMQFQAIMHSSYIGKEEQQSIHELFQPKTINKIPAMMQQKIPEKKKQQESNQNIFQQLGFQTYDRPQEKKNLFHNSRYPKSKK